MGNAAALLLLGLFLLASVIAVAAIVAARRRSELGRTMRAASAVVSTALTGSDDAFSGLGEPLAHLFDADACVIALPTGDGRLRCGPAYGYGSPETLFIGDDEGICGAVFTTGEPIVTRVDKDPRYIERLPGMRYAIAVPIMSEGRSLGAVNLESRSRRYTRSDLDVLQPLADQLAAVLVNRELRSAAEERASAAQIARSELQAISSVVLAGVASSNDLDAALQSMVQEISVQMGWESMAVILFADDGALTTRAYYGYPLHSTIVKFVPGHGIVGRVAQTGTGHLAPDVSVDPYYLGVVNDTRSEMCQPLIAGDRILGVLNAESMRLHAFDEDDFSLLGRLAGQMAIVIEQARIADLERKASELLRETDQLKDDFVATVSHELRTPLTSIKGYARTLLVRDEQLNGDDRRSFLEVMVRQCDRLSATIDTLLLASRLESDQVRRKPSFILVDHLLDQAREDMAATDRIEIHCAQGVGIVGDAFRIEHVVRNLLENALKYSPPGSPILARAGADGDDVTIEVLDRGPGIPAGSEEVIFERFRRLPREGRSSASGTGLGLYIARRFARDLGGDLVLAPPEEGWPGAHMVMRVPAALPQADEDPAGAEGTRTAPAEAHSV